MASFEITIKGTAPEEKPGQGRAVTLSRDLLQADVRAFTDKFVRDLVPRGFVAEDVNFDFGDVAEGDDDDEPWPSTSTKPPDHVFWWRG